MKKQNKRQFIKNQNASDNNEKEENQVGMSEDVRVIFSEESNPADG